MNQSPKASAFLAALAVSLYIPITALSANQHVENLRVAEGVVSQPVGHPLSNGAVVNKLVTDDGRILAVFARTKSGKITSLVNFGATSRRGGLGLTPKGKLVVQEINRAPANGTAITVLKAGNNRVLAVFSETTSGQIFKIASFGSSPASSTHTETSNRQAQHNKPTAESGVNPNTAKPQFLGGDPYFGCPCEPYSMGSGLYFYMTVWARSTFGNEIMVDSHVLAVIYNTAPDGHVQVIWRRPPF